MAQPLTQSTVGKEPRLVLRHQNLSVRSCYGPHNPHTLDKEQMRGSILSKPIGEILDDSIHVLAGGHQQIDGLKLGLWITIARYRFYHYAL